MRTPLKLFSMVLIAAPALTLSAYADEPFDIQSQIGPNPVLPQIRQYLFPPMHLSSVVGWKNGETPTVAAGLKIETLATGFQHPRSLYTLPNGDVLVVESKAPPPQPITRPKDLVMRFIEKGVTSGAFFTLATAYPRNTAAAPSSANTEVGTGRPSTVTGSFSCPSAAGVPTAEDVVTGFLDADGRARGRPVGLAIDKTGALLIADDVGNTVWRISSAG
ncbi:MAG TPA: hypothetical protein VGG61_12885, partial [Gemmataceae bacterium]